ncbi:hypothetical protein PENSPDRAFT_101382 [Peniophora sp. CONT]|nr:hypothetical protein PENSPDRAFT_101382 [Peniophora sp. CONT]
MLRTPTLDLPDGIKIQVESTNSSRLSISDEFKDSMKGAAKVAIVALGVAAQTTQNVPYLGAISTALTEFIKIHDEVDECKDECRTAIVDAQTLKTLIEKFRDKCIKSGKGEGVLDESLQEAFTELESVVLECIIVLQKCKVESKRKRDRLRLYFRRSILAKSAKDCSAKMTKALQRFNTSLQVDQVVLLDDIRLAIDEIREARSPKIPRVTASNSSYVL